MSIRKHKQSGIWWVDFTPPSGQRIRRSTGTRNRQQAQEYHDKLKAEFWRVYQLGDKPKRLFEEACINYLTLSAGQKDYATKIRHVKYWRTVFGGRTICSLTSDEIQAGLPTHRTYKDRPTKKLSASTRNKYLTSIGRILSLAKQAGWIDVTPIVHKLPEPKIRVRWLTKDQSIAFLDSLNLEWMKDVCKFALATGCRANEIFTLTWDKVDLDSRLTWVTNDLAKSGRSRPVPLNTDAMAVLLKRPKDKYVFTRIKGGAKIRQIDRRDFIQALTKIGLSDFRFHDLRHTWASWHAQAGTPLFALKELGGWETLDMVKKYAHLNAEHLAKYANHVTISAQSVHADNIALPANNDKPLIFKAL